MMGFGREWPKMIPHLHKRAFRLSTEEGLIDIDDDFIQKFGLLEF